MFKIKYLLLKATVHNHRRGRAAMPGMPGTTIFRRFRFFAKFKEFLRKNHFLFFVFGVLYQREDGICSE